MTDDERFKKWGEWIMVIYEDVENAIQSRCIHNEIGAILQANPRLWRDNNSFYRWMASNAILARYMAGPTQRRDVEDRSFSAEDLLEDVSAVIRRLEARGIDRVLYAELPSPLDVAHCVRVLAPQLEGVVDKPWYKPGRRALALAKMLQ